MRHPDPLPRIALVAALLVGGCGLSDARPEGCDTLDEAGHLVGTWLTQVLTGAHGVTEEINVDHALAVASQVDLAGWGSMFNDIFLIGWCETPQTFDPTCAGLMPGAEMCVEVACDGLNAATITTTVNAVDATGTPRAAFVYTAVNEQGTLVHDASSTYVWKVAPDGEGRFALDGAYAADVLWVRPGRDVTDLSYTAALTSEQIDGEVGTITAHVELPGIEPGVAWAVDLVDDPQGTTSRITRDGAPAGHLEWATTTGEDGHVYPYLRVVLDGTCEGSAS